MELNPFRLEDSPGWRRVRENRLFDHPYIQIDEIEYETPNREEPVSWTIARRKAGVVVAPRLEDGRFLMIQQERYPIQRVIWEFPAGQIDHPSGAENTDVIEEAARRELLEETGYEVLPGGGMTSLGYFFRVAGFHRRTCLSVSGSGDSTH